MNKYFASVRVSGTSVKTLVFADSALHARLILEFQFGAGSIVSSPVLSSGSCAGYKSVKEVVATSKPNTPQIARIEHLKKQRDAITKSLESERNRQKIAKAHAQIRSATTQISK